MNNLPEALSLVPLKARLPVERLIARGLIDQATVDVALDAVLYAGKPERLLPFMTAVLHLKSNAVSIADIVRMARAHGRPINLDWSPRRWQEEHQRLSRLETLKALSAANVAYELDRFRQLLPASFPGYLVPSSRRLGAEGLHQLHCVASYHPAILSGHCAIAVVFVDRKRFTVQLALVGDRLRVTQIRTRLNALPSSDESRRIRDVLRLQTDPSEEGDSSHINRRVPFKQVLVAVLPALRNHGVEEVKASFDGSTDDQGSVDSASFRPQIDAESVFVDVPQIAQQFVDGEYVNVAVVTTVTLQRAVDSLAASYIDSQPVNWWDADGGFGSFVIDVQSGVATIEINVRSVESHCELVETLEADCLPNTQDASLLAQA